MTVKRPYLDAMVIADIKLIATQLGIPESVVIDRLIMKPLLQ